MRFPPQSAAPSVMILAALVTACSPNGAELETRTFPLESLAPEEAQTLVGPYIFYDRAENPGTMTATAGALTVRETSDNLDKIARILDEYDVQSPALRLHFQLVEAGDVSGDRRASTAVTEQLQRLFDAAEFRVVGDAYVSVLDQGSFGQSLSGSSAEYHIQAQVSRTAGGVIRLQDVALHGPRGVALSTTVNLRPGQTLVLGSSHTGSNENILFLTVQAESEEVVEDG